MQQKDKKTGRVEKLVRRRGFGFIIDMGDQRYFFHVKNTTNRQFPPRGNVVQFEVVPSPTPGQLDLAINVEAL